jgi:hypothetical protein
VLSLLSRFWFMIISVPLQNFFLNTGTHNFHSSPVQPLHVVKRKAHDLGKSIRLDWYYTPAQSFLHCRQGCQEIRCNYRMPACVSPMHALHDMSILTLQASSLYSRLLFMLLKVILSQSLCHCYRCGISCYFPRRNASTLMSGFVLTSIEVASA